MGRTSVHFQTVYNFTEDSNQFHVLSCMFGCQDDNLPYKSQKYQILIFFPITHYLITFHKLPNKISQLNSCVNQ